MLKIRIVLMVGLCVFFLGCGLDSQQQAALDEAVKSLRKIDAATQVGVNFPKYGELMIEAKTKMNDADRLLPDGELKKELRSTMMFYELAHQNWNNSVEANANTLAGVDEKYENLMTMRQNWETAREHLEKVSKLID